MADSNSGGKTPDAVVLPPTVEKASDKTDMTEAAFNIGSDDSSPSRNYKSFLELCKAFSMGSLLVSSSCDL